MTIPLTTREWTLLISIVAYSSIPALGGMIRLLELAGGPALVPENPRVLAAPLPAILHIVGSFVFCIAGAMQFLPSLRHRHPSIHRKMGRVLVIAGCVSAASGVWMTLFFTFPDALQGSLLFSARIILGFLMIGLIGRAVLAVRARDFKRHGALMLRAYAIGQGASTQALLGIGWIVISGAEPAGLLRDLFMVLCWLLNLLGAEFLIHRSIINPRSTSPAPI
ncbi:MAG: putative membrane protein [Paracoccaceae bacterium]|jgi:uncharacterized membrane protein